MSLTQAFTDAKEQASRCQPTVTLRISLSIGDGCMSIGNKPFRAWPADGKISLRMPYC
jgi:hypothetical protein